MSSSPETPTYTTGAHRAHPAARKRVAPRTVPQSPAPPAPTAPLSTHYEPFLDGLFTYCLSVLCDHDAATAALGEVLALAERRGGRPDGDTRAWLYALARWMCLRALAESKQRGRHGAHAPAAGAASGASPSAATAGPPVAPPGPAPAPHTAPAAQAGLPAHPLPGTPAAPAPSAAPEDDLAQARRRELAQLAWPEAAGTTPEQREALELAVRHRLSPKEVAAVLGLDPAAARDLLASAACEVERTRAALAVVETGTCPIVARLTGDNQVLLGTALRRELVRHVDDCPRCRRTAERAGSSAWPGTAVTPAALPVVAAPRAALHHAMAHAPRAQRRARGGGPRFDRRGFPMDPKDHAARRERLRARAVTTTVVATVVAAPVLALWAAYRGAPLTGEGHDGRTTGVTEADGGPGKDGGHGREDYENAGNARTTPDPRFRGGRGGPGVSVEVISPGGPAAPGAGRIGVQARSHGGVTLITLTGGGSSPVRWSASTGASWLVLSQSAGTLSPGESVTIRVYVDDDREPPGHWSARVSIAPTGAVISLEGYGSSGSPGRPDNPGPRPTATRPGPSNPDPTPTPGNPTPTPTTQPPDPTPTAPTPTPSDPSTPTPTPSNEPGQG
ncbi:BACON domain-containing protein [Streptomyces lasiicapitis]|uniref:BACON domain-containing protein n=1 Tax=Streptomyces lasiicapitis TaxID=1923961 RepID=UPI0036A927E2